MLELPKAAEAERVRRTIVGSIGTILVVLLLIYTIYSSVHGKDPRQPKAAGVSVMPADLDAATFWSFLV